MFQTDLRHGKQNQCKTSHSTLLKDNQLDRRGIDRQQFKNIQNIYIKDDFKVQYLTVCESKKCKRYQVRESSQCEAEEVHF